MSRIDDLYHEIHDLPRRLKNSVQAILDPVTSSPGGAVLAFWQQAIRDTEGRGTPHQQEVDEFVQHVDDVLSDSTLRERLDWLRQNQEVIVCGTFGWATSFVSNFVSACPGYSLGHERIYKQDRIDLKPALAGYLRGDVSGAAWKYLPHLDGGGLGIVQLIRHPLHACGSMMNNTSAHLPETFDACARYWYEHHMMLENAAGRHVVRIEDWEFRHKGFLNYLGLQSSPACWDAVEGSKANPRGGDRPWTWEDLPVYVRSLARQYGYGP